MRKAVLKKIRSIFCVHKDKLPTGFYMSDRYTSRSFLLYAEFYCFYCGSMAWKNLGAKVVDCDGVELFLAIASFGTTFQFRGGVAADDYSRSASWDDFFKERFPGGVLPFIFADLDRI